MTPKRPRGRPPTTDAEKAKARRAQRRVGPRLYPAEVERYTAAAKAAGMSREAWMRMVMDEAAITAGESPRSGG